MNYIGGLIFGVIAGIAGALIWAAIAYYVNMEIGLLAWGIGAGVGFAMAMGSKNMGLVPAVAAGIITIASLCGGKYLAVHFSMSEFDKQVAEEQPEWTDDAIIFRIAYDNTTALIDSGQDIEWQNGATLDTVESIEDYPPEVLSDAEEQFDNMAPEARAAIKAELTAEYDQFIAAARSQIANEGFFASFGLFDIIFFLLGIFTAGKIAYGDGSNHS